MLEAQREPVLVDTRQERPSCPGLAGFPSPAVMAEIFQGWSGIKPGEYSGGPDEEDKEHDPRNAPWFTRTAEECGGVGPLGQPCPNGYEWRPL